MEFLTTFGMALMPVAVMKDCIALGLDLRMSLPACYAAAVLGIMCPVPFLLAVVTDEADGELSGSGIMGRYGEAVILLFAAMPFLAGATWISAVLSAFLHIDVKKALPLLLLGSMISGGIAVMMLR